MVVVHRGGICVHLSGAGVHKGGVGFMSHTAKGKECETAMMVTAQLPGL